MNKSLYIAIALGLVAGLLYAGYSDGKAGV